MSKYMIHTMPKREWYVRDFLIPSMLAQGIDESCIKVYNDVENAGNLKACINAFSEVEGNGGTWHLQDDIIISHDFKEQTEAHDDGIVCGFKSFYDGDNPAGIVNREQMWFSFLCIRIPNNIATDCAEWIRHYMIGNPVYAEWWEDGKNDDMLFRKYLEQYHKDIKALNLNPNIVDHIDYLIGGTVNSSKRIRQIRSKHWTDEYLVDELKMRLKEYHGRKRN